MLVGGGGQPLPQHVPADLGEAVGLAPPATVLGLDGQQPHPFKPRRLRVQLRVREGPEAADRAADLTL